MYAKLGVDKHGTVHDLSAINQAPMCGKLLRTLVVPDRTRMTCDECEGRRNMRGPVYTVGA